MTAKDQLKVLKAGFKIVRIDESSNSIKIKTAAHSEWHIFIKDFASRAERTRSMKHLLEDKMTIED